MQPLGDVQQAEPIVAGSVLRMGASVELDGRISWAPHEPGRCQPINCYLVFEEDQATLVDTGPALFRNLIIEQLGRVRPRDLPLTAFMTRSELECSGNLTAIHDIDPVDRVIIGGGQNPFDGYDEVTRGANTSVERQALPNTSNSVTPLGTSKRLLLIPARMRILTTYWLYDKASRTLFSSDTFGHTSQRPDASAIVSSLADDDTTRESAERHLLTKYAWLREARTGPLRDWLARIFDEFDIEIIAPTHGRVLKGKDLVNKHYAILQDILRSVGM